jgi:polysaccharide deacetylase family sporulation protein PdaB
MWKRGINVIRDKRILRRKKRFFVYIAVALSLLAVILHRQITERVFNRLITGAYYQVDTDEKAMALTFDAVWEPGETARILDILDRHNVRATFFLSGQWIRNNPDVTREIIIRGHEIGHHGYAHKDLTALDDEALNKEFSLMEEALREELNTAAHLLRPPYGELDERVFSMATEKGYTIVLWSIDPHDWLDPGADKIVSRVVNSAHKGGIILLHTNAAQSVEALPLIIQNLRLQEYTLLPFSELLETAK